MAATATEMAVNNAAFAVPLLRVNSIEKHYGGVQALKGVSFELHTGEILGLIGPNGSGKSTCVNVLSGAVKLTMGNVELGGVDVAGLPMDEVVKLGMIRTYQATQTFPEFSAIENVLVGCHTRCEVGPFAAVLGFSKGRHEKDRIYSEAMEALAFVGLNGREQQVAATMSAADQRLLMIAIMIAAKPKVILLDEPAAGMIASERKELAEVIRRLPQRGVSVLVIEHHMGLIMSICDRIVVLNFGQKIGEGTPGEIRENQSVIEAYLGHRDAEHH